MNIEKIERKRIKFEPYAIRVISRALKKQYFSVLKLPHDMIKPESVNIITPEEMKRSYNEVYRRVAKSFARDTFRELNKKKDFVDVDPEINRVIQYELLRRISAVTDYTKETLRRVIEKALEEGLSIPNTIKLIRADLPDIIKWRAERIARTEIVAASNAGSLAGAEATGLDYKKIWLARLDSRVRDSHALANNQKVGKNEPFRVGGIVLRYPGDPIGTADEVVNCRCAIGYDVLGLD